jgi:hypothetical protein
MGTIKTGWVKPEQTATPLTGYRKRAVSASDSGSIQEINRRPPATWGPFRLVAAA